MWELCEILRKNDNNLQYKNKIQYGLGVVKKFYEG